MALIELLENFRMKRQNSIKNQSIDCNRTDETIVI